MVSMPIVEGPPCFTVSRPFTSLRSMSGKIVWPRKASARFAPSSFTQLKFVKPSDALVRFAFVRCANLRSASERFALLRSTPVRFAFWSLALLKSAPWRCSSLRSAPMRSAVISRFVSLHLFQTSTPCLSFARCFLFARTTPFHLECSSYPAVAKKVDVEAPFNWLTGDPPNWGVCPS